MCNEVGGIKTYVVRIDNGRVVIGDVLVSVEVTGSGWVSMEMEVQLTVEL